MAAKKQYASVGPAYPERDYQCEEDVRTLSRAAEVMADTGRRKGALRKFKTQQAGGQRLIDVLSGSKFKRS